MKYLLTIVAVLMFQLSFSQVELKKTSLSSGGGVASSGSLYMVYAIGEVGVQEADAGNIHLSEGFVGPDMTYLLGVEDYGQLEGLQIYPNPVKDKLNIQLPETGNYEVYLFDLTGKQLWQNNIENNSYFSYQMRDYKPGIYLLTVVDRENKKSLTFKVQKQ